MTTPTAAPTGRLIWAQSGQYNAIDDRLVIHGLSGRRQGIFRRPAIRPEPGLVVRLTSWAGVVETGDDTSAVVGTTGETLLPVAAGPASGSRTEFIWCDINVPAGTWTLNRISPAQAAGRIGIRVGTITAPAGATQASQMQLDPSILTFGGAGGMLTRAWHRDYERFRSAVSFEAAAQLCHTEPVFLSPGRYYRLVGYTPSAMITTDAEGPYNRLIRIAIGNGNNQIGPSSITRLPQIEAGQFLRCEWTGTFTSRPEGWVFHLRFWTGGSGRNRFTPDALLQGLQLTVEDCGPTHYVLPWG